MERGDSLKTAKEKRQGNLHPDLLVILPAADQRGHPPGGATHIMGSHFVTHLSAILAE